MMVTVVSGLSGPGVTPGPGGIVTTNVSSGDSGSSSSVMPISVHTRVDPDVNVTSNVSGL